MVRWPHKLDVSDVWRNENMTFEEQRDAIAKRIRGAAWNKSDPGDEGHARNASDALAADVLEELEDIVVELSKADNIVVFDAWWNQVYDWADANRVWIKTSSWM